MRKVRTAVIVLSIILTGSIPALAQNDVNLAQGFEPYKSYMSGNIDSVSLTNGNLILHIPVVSYPQRGGRLNLAFYLRYNNKTFVQVSNGSVVWAFDVAVVDVQLDQLWV